MTRTAIIGDIHGHLPGLEAFCAIDEHECFDEILCVGDLVEYGGDDEAVVARVRERGIPCVRGNHDQDNQLGLSAAMQDWLSALPLSLQTQRVTLCHHSQDLERGLAHSGELGWQPYAGWLTPVAAVGHRHRPVIHQWLPGSDTGVQLDHRSGPVPLVDGARYLLVVPSLAYNRSDDPRPGFMVIDWLAGTIDCRFLDVPPLVKGDPV